MNGHILSGTNIAVDYWKIKGTCDNFIHFLTHLHGDHIAGLTSSWQRPIYCSRFTADLLIKRHGLSESLLRVCPLNQAITVIECTSRSFIVTAYDANHCPGAVMFYFQGYFGNIFYTGDFRSSSQVIENCKHLINEIDTLYLDNTFCSPECVFPSRDECLMTIIDIIKHHPQHDVVIGVRNLGKELLLAKLGSILNETICVSPICYQISQMLFTTDVFTTLALNKGKCRVQTVSLHTINRKYVESLNATKQTIAIIPSAIFTGLGCQPFCRDPNIFVVPYSDHSCFLELLDFVSSLKPAKVLPIVRNSRGPFGISISDREDMSCFISVLSKDRADRKVQKYGSKEDRMLTSTLNDYSQHEHVELDAQSQIVVKKSNPIECSNLTSLLPSNLQQLGHPRTRRKHIRHASRHLRRITRGVVYMNPVSDDNNEVNVNPDVNNGISVNTVSSNGGIFINPLSDVKSTDCTDIVDCIMEKGYNEKINTFLVDEDNQAHNSNDVCIECPDSPEEFNKKVKQQTGFSFTNSSGLLKETVGFADGFNKRIEPGRMLSDQSIVEVNSNSIVRHACRFSRTKFRPIDLCASSRLLLKHHRLPEPRNDSIKQTKDSIAALQKFVRKSS